MNTINSISANSLPVDVDVKPALLATRKADARAPRAQGKNLASPRSQVDQAARDHIPYITQEQLRGLLSENQIQLQRLEEITKSFMQEILDGRVGIKNLMAPQGTVGKTQEYLMFRGVPSGETVLIPGIPGAVYFVPDRVNVSQSRAMTEEERKKDKKEVNEFDGECHRTLLRHVLTMYGYLRLDDSPEHHAARPVDNLHIHPDDCRPSFPDILGAGTHPDDLSIVMTRNHLYIILFPDRPHSTAPLKNCRKSCGHALGAEFGRVPGFRGQSAVGSSRPSGFAGAPKVASAARGPPTAGLACYPVQSLPQNPLQNTHAQQYRISYFYTRV